MGGGRGGRQDPVGGDAGVVPRVFWHQVGDEEGTVHQDLHSGLQRSEEERDARDVHRSSDPVV